MTTTASGAVCRVVTEIGEERVAEVAEGRLDDVEREADVVPFPVAPYVLRLFGIESEEDGADVFELEGLREGDCPERGAVDARNEYAPDHAIADGGFSGDERHVGDHDAGLLEQPQLQLE